MICLKSSLSEVFKYKTNKFRIIITIKIQL